MSHDCEYCGKTFGSANAAFQHTKAKHPGKSNKWHAQACTRSTHRRGGSQKASDPSMADLVIEARMNAAMGEPVDDWLGDMFHDDIYGD